MLKITSYPTKAWVLQPSFKPVEVEIVKSAYAHSYPGYHSTARGKFYGEAKLFCPPGMCASTSTGSASIGIVSPRSVSRYSRRGAWLSRQHCVCDLERVRMHLCKTTPFMSTLVTNCECCCG